MVPRLPTGATVTAARTLCVCTERYPSPDPEVPVGLALLLSCQSRVLQGFRPTAVAVERSVSPVALDARPPSSQFCLDDNPRPPGQVPPRVTHPPRPPGRTPSALPVP